MGPPEIIPMTSLTESDSHESPAISRKRKNSANESGAGRTVKHRSSQACQSCRMRKVRCDVIVNGSRCTNCRLDDAECIVLASRRGKNNHTNRKSSTTQATAPSPQQATILGDSGPERTETKNWQDYEVTESPATPHGPGSGRVPASVTFEEDSDRQRNGQAPTADDTTENETDLPSSEVDEGFMTSEPGTNPSNQYQSPARKTLLPSFITPLSTRIASDDLEFLARKGALTVPEPDLCLDVLRGYLFSIHPFMPMLDFRAFISAILNDQQDSTISLLLFQAVMFAGVNSLPLELINRLGFKSVKQARKVYFARVKLLYDFEVEMDDAAVLQACILMSLWYGRWDDRRHTWHWTGLAYDTARGMGLHREPTAKNVSEKVRRFRRRLWWSIYIRDRMIALGTRRPMRIRDDDFEVAILTLEDFDLEALEEPDPAQPILPNTGQRTSTALMCVELVKLCTCIGHVMSSQCTVLNSQPDIPHTMMVVSRRNGNHTQELENCDRELKEWFRALDTNVRRTSPPPAQDGPHNCSEVHWEILNMTYLTVMNVLHRSQALQPLPDTTEAQVVRRSSRSKVKEAARSLTKLSQTMLRQDEVKFLGPIGVTALVAACLSHMLDISSADDEDVRDASTFRLYQSLQVLQSLRDIYASADASVSFLASVTRKSGIPVPTQFTAPAADLSSTSGRGLVRTSTDDGRNLGRKDSTDWPHRARLMSNDSLMDTSTSWSANSSRFPIRSTIDLAQSQSLLNGSDQVLSPSSVSPSGTGTGMMGMAGSNSRDLPVSRQKPTDTVVRNQNADHQADPFVGAGFGGHAGLSVDEAFLDWNNAMDTGMDFGTMAFSYDYHSDPLGFSESLARRM